MIGGVALVGGCGLEKQLPVVYHPAEWDPLGVGRPHLLLLSTVSWVTAIRKHMANDLYGHVSVGVTGVTLTQCLLIVSKNTHSAEGVSQCKPN